jgi:hypothetical protein
MPSRSTEVDPFTRPLDSWRRDRRTFIGGLALGTLAGLRAARGVSHEHAEYRHVIQ